MSSPSYLPVSLWECQCCGMAVSCRETHDRWHAAQERKEAMIYTTIWPGIQGRARLVNDNAPHLGWVLEVINDHPEQIPSRYATAHAKGTTLEQAWEQLCYFVDLRAFLG